MNSERKKIKLWVESWKRSAIELEKEKRNKLRLYDYSKNQIFIDKMLQWACENKKIRLSTGLVEQQRLFMKIRGNYLLNRNASAFPPKVPPISMTGGLTTGSFKTDNGKL